MWNSPDSYIQPPTSISTWPLHRHPNLTLPQLSSILLLRGFTRSVGGSCNSTSLYPGQKPYSLLISSCSLSHAPNLIANLTYVSIIKGCPDWTRLTILHSTTMVQVTKLGDLDHSNGPPTGLPALSSLIHSALQTAAQ